MTYEIKNGIDKYIGSPNVKKILNIYLFPILSERAAQTNLPDKLPNDNNKTN